MLEDDARDVARASLLAMVDHFRALLIRDRLDPVPRATLLKEAGRIRNLASRFGSAPESAPDAIASVADGSLDALRFEAKLKIKYLFRIILLGKEGEFAPGFFVAEVERILDLALQLSEASRFHGGNGHSGPGD